MPCIVVWGGYLLAFWPALLGNDELGEWAAVLRSELTNSIPAFHALMLWLVTRVWQSPAAVVVAQIVACAAVFASVVTELDAWGVPPWVRRLCVAISAGSLVNGMMLVTIGRDVAYAIANLALFSVLLRLVRTEGSWLLARRRQAILWLVLTCVSLFRHNGVIAAAAILVLISVAWRGPVARPARRVGLAWVMTYCVITLPVYRLLAVGAIEPRVRMQYALHQIAALVSHDVPLADDERALLESIEPIDKWRAHYSCYSVDPLIWGEDFSAAALEGKAENIARLWLRLLRAYPQAVLRHQLCASSFVWRIREPHSTRLFTVPLGRYLGERAGAVRPFGIEGSRWPWLADTLVRCFRWSVESKRIWWVWRPAVYLYLTLLCGVATAVRLGNPRVLMLAAPSVINSLVWLVFGMAQHFRYQFPVYMIALILPVVMASKPPATAQG